MRANMAKAMGINESQLNIKATTEEKLGFTGREEGIASQAICLQMCIRDSLYPMAGAQSLYCLGIKLTFWTVNGFVKICRRVSQMQMCIRDRNFYCDNKEHSRLGIRSNGCGRSCERFCA